MALLGCMNVVKAQYAPEGSITISDAVIQKGGYGYIALTCNFAEFQDGKSIYNGLQIKCQLPEGFTFDSGKTDTKKVGIDSPMFSFSNNKGESSLLFINMQGQVINSGEYELMRIYIHADESLEAKTYSIPVNINLSGVDTKDYPIENLSPFNIEVTEATGRVLSENATELPEDNYYYLKITYDTKKVPKDPNDPNSELIDWLYETKREEGTVAENFIVQRTIKANTWSTMCLPFKMTLAELVDVFGDDVVLAKWDDINLYGKSWEYSNDQLTLNFFTLDPTDPDYEEIFDSRKPFLIKTSKTFTEFKAKNKYLGNYDETIDEESERLTSVSKLNTTITGQSGIKKGYFEGVLVAGKVPEDGLFFSGNKFYYSSGESSIKAFRGYFSLKDVLNNKNLSGSANVSIAIDDVPTYIDGISTKYIGNDDVYSVSGIKMGITSDLNHMKPGLYIVNGKKVIVK